MLRGDRGPDEEGVEDRGRRVLALELVVLGDERLHTTRLLVNRPLAEVVERLLEVADVLLRLLGVVLEAARQLLVTGLLLQLLERLQDLLLSFQLLRQLEDEELARIVNGHGQTPSSRGQTASTGCPRGLLRKLAPVSARACARRRTSRAPPAPSAALARAPRRAVLGRSVQGL